jgi:hypothetical protein
MWPAFYEVGLVGKGPRMVNESTTLCNNDTYSMNYVLSAGVTCQMGWREFLTDDN